MAKLTVKEKLWKYFWEYRNSTWCGFKHHMKENSGVSLTTINRLISEKWLIINGDTTGDDYYKKYKIR